MLKCRYMCVFVYECLNSTTQELHVHFLSVLQITNILDKSPVWREYREQKHDLFISDTPIAGYLTGQNITNHLLLYKQ